MSGSGMQDLHLVDLGPAGNRHLESVLRDVTGAGAHWRTMVAEGRCSAVLPPDTGLDRALEFAHGGLLKTARARDWLARYLHPRLVPGTALLYQDIWASPSDPAPAANRAVRRIAGSDGVYFYLEAESFSAEHFAAFLRSGASFTKVVGLTRAARISGDVDVVADKLARDTSELFVNAYDQESWVLWRTG